MESFHGGYCIAQLCPDNLHLLACRQTGVNFLVASLLLLQLCKYLDFPGNANVGNLRTCPDTVFLSCCSCCLLGKSSSGRARHSQGLLYSFSVNADSFHRKLSNRDTKSCSSAAIREYECCNDCSPFAGVSCGESPFITSTLAQIFGHSKDHQRRRKKH